jgi:hypothetical protein
LVLVARGPLPNGGSPSPLTSRSETPARALKHHRRVG